LAFRRDLGVSVRFVVVGTPGDRRVTMFHAAAIRSGLPEPQLISWRDVLTGGDVRIPAGSLVRVDSPGEDARTDALLRGPGDPTRVGGGAVWYRAFRAALRRVDEAVRASPGAAPLGDIGEIAVMFDKRICHARLADAGVPVPPALRGPIGSYRDLRAQMAAMGWTRVFVKPAHGSSASGVIALQTSPSRVKAVTSVAWPGDTWRGRVSGDGVSGDGASDGGASDGGVSDGGVSEGGVSEGGVSEGAVFPYNSLRVRVYEDEADVAAIVDRLAPDGLHVERWFPKASLDGRAFDLRVVVIAGTPTHVVVRTSRTPMTNLHLGGARGDLTALRERLGAGVWERAMDVCAQAAARFPRSLCAGVDLMIGTDRRSMAVAEVNAFGDLLPGLTGLPGTPGEGLDTYATQIAAVSRGWRPPDTAARRESSDLLTDRRAPCDAEKRGEPRGPGGLESAVTDERSGTGESGDGGQTARRRGGRSRGENELTGVEGVMSCAT
jgi:hypothetical protein